MKIKILSIGILSFMNVFSLFAQSSQVAIAKSKIEWKGTKAIGEHNGVIAIKKGTIVLTNGKITGGEIIIDMKGITVVGDESVGDKKHIIKDISHKAFFNVKGFPTSKIVIKEVTDGILKGDLTIKGKTNPVSFKVEYKLTNGKLIANSANFSIDRQDWDLVFNSFLKEKILDDSLQFKVHIETQKVANKSTTKSGE